VNPPEKSLLIAFIVVVCVSEHIYNNKYVEVNINFEESTAASEKKNQEVLVIGSSDK